MLSKFLYEIISQRDSDVYFSVNKHNYLISTCIRLQRIYFIKSETIHNEFNRNRFLLGNMNAKGLYTNKDCFNLSQKCCCFKSLSGHFRYVLVLRRYSKSGDAFFVKFSFITKMIESLKERKSS